MARVVTDPMKLHLARQYERLLRLSIAADWICSDAEQRLLRWAILARYRDMVDLDRVDEARDLLAWRDAEKARLERSQHEAAA